MEKLRKRLAILFGCLSAIFASIAIYNYVRAPEISEDDTNVATQKWDRDIEQYARKNSKLIFFSTNLSKFKPSKTSKKILDQHYISVEISPDTYPADYFILDSLLARKARNYRPLQAGILSPNLHPIYLTSQYSTRSSNNAPTLNEALALAINHFEKNPFQLRSTARNATKFDSLPQSFFSRFHFSDMFTQISFMHTETAHLYTYFKSEMCKTDSPAIISENSRLASKISALEPNQMISEQTAKIAIRQVCNRYPNETSITSKLLYLRAIGDSPLLKNKKSLYSFFIKNTKSFIPKTRNNDANFLGYKSMAMRDLALMTSVFAKAFSVSGEIKFFKEAEKLATLLENKIQTSPILPAKIGVDSEASSLEYVLCARAFFDIAKFSNNNKWTEVSLNTISKWNELFMTDINLWSINSKKSALAKYARPIITRDGIVPSYIGEASQLFAELGILNNKTGKLLRKISIGATSDSPLSSHNWASLKLAMLPQYTPPTL